MKIGLERSREPFRDTSARNNRATLRRLARYFTARKDTLLLLLAVTFICIGADISAPLLIERCIDSIALSRAGGLISRLSEGTFTKYLAFYLALSVFSALAGYVHDILSTRLSLSAEVELRNSLSEKIVSAPLADSETWSAGDSTSRLLNDTTLTARAFSEAALSLLSSGIVILCSAGIMFFKNPVLAGITVAASLLSVLITSILAGRLMPEILRRQGALGILYRHVEETVEGFSTCVVGGREKENLRLMKQLSEAYSCASIGAAKWEGLLEPMMLLFGNMNLMLILVFGVRFVINGTASLGTIQLFILYSRQFMEPINELGETFAQVQASIAGAERIFEILDAREEPSGAGEALDARDEAGEILRFSDVRFSYRSDRQILRGVRFCMKHGSRVALVGETGAGKTTLASLIPLLYDGYDGEIFLNGVELHQYDLRDLRRRVVMVPQQPQVIDGTIRENVAYGSSDVPDEALWRALSVACLSETVSAFPNGLDTELRSDAPQLSQGQLQMLCLARAVLQDAELVIFDEATSSIDAATEAALTASLSAVLEGRSCLMIAHRLTSITDADMICVLHDGVIAETGTHTELMERGGVYCAAFSQQTPFVAGELKFNSFSNG